MENAIIPLFCIFFHFFRRLKPAQKGAERHFYARPLTLFSFFIFNS